ncbi:MULTISPECIES: MarR family winged helix-turn-helix transcriptional regulator [Peribacillus]|uniref:MarR family winged helix-turn-helix transcriptional regulator n=1 Tax=Peribacillus TaxID=2675229 RepID=UPI001913E4F5|nr:MULTISPECIES: MarR family transcriptional regulator [unclassified Peribacillus]MBK5445053.1 MarR family transcriptional regulator [Peribacillus sp. TH24]MBK5482037.1 MarR family transcriptional regulator [Peribacillus sp. TH16]MBK5498415.1 MarR family transcriptional regulator [Peribacillus sp. TH14]WMX56474.1 MarR family transcriptional regulator [Peribacillus sp. R9-11]
MKINNNTIADIRQFNRFYTNILGVLDKHIFDTGYSLTEARVVLEIGMMEQCIANNLVDKLEIDRSYMSRIINKLSKDGLVIKENSTLDNRTSLIRLTPKGMTLFNQLNERSDEQLVRLFQGLSQNEIKEIHASMMFIQKKLDSLGRI